MIGITKNVRHFYFLYVFNFVLQLLFFAVTGLFSGQYPYGDKARDGWEGSEKGPKNRMDRSR